MSYIMENEIETSSSLCELYKHTKNRIPTKLRLDIRRSLFRKYEQFSEKSQVQGSQLIFKRDKGKHYKTKLSQENLSIAKKFKNNCARNKLSRQKCLIFWKTTPKLFRISANWNNKQKVVFKPKYFQRILCLRRNCKESCNSNLCH